MIKKIKVIKKKSITKQLPRAKELNKSTIKTKKLLLPIKVTKQSPKTGSKKSLNQVSKITSKTPVKTVVPITIQKNKQKLPKIKPDKLMPIKENHVSKAKKKSPITKSISNITSALTLKTDNTTTTPSMITEIFATYYMYVINETRNKIPEPLELSIVKDLLLKLVTKEDYKYTSILEYLIAKGKQHKIEIKQMTHEEFRKFILKLSTIEETEWVKVIPENNMEQLLIKLLKIKR